MTPGAAPVLRIAILTHNALAHTERCIASLQEHTRAPWQALVLDNASSDATPSYLAALHDARVQVRCGTDNLGVSGGRNWLFARLLPEMAANDLLVFLDNDIEVAEGWETPFIEAFAEMPRLGVAGRWAFSMLVHEHWRDILAEHSADSGPADTVQGCCFWVRAAAARDVGGFDESLGRFWHEDDDFCIRALHAGWDVRRVRCAAITHHEHGSGLALRPERVAGSLANQDRLARKWRAMGAIDADGVPKRPLPDPTLDARSALGTRLERGGPVLRTELGGAIDDATRLLHTTVTDARAAVLASPAARLVLRDSEHDASDDVRTLAVRAGARIARVLETRRAESALPAPSRTGGRSFNGICNPAAWDDPRWAESFTTLLQDGRGRDFYARNETDWRDGQILHALRVTGALSQPRRVLVLGHPGERTIAALSQYAAHLTVCDEAPISPERVSQCAARPLGPAALDTLAWPLREAHEKAPRYDVVICPNLTRYAKASATLPLLRLLSSYVLLNGWLAAGVSVRLAGPADGRWLEPSILADDAMLAGAGLRRAGRFDCSVADETLLAAIPAGGAEHWRPRLARELPPHRVTLATLFARRT